MTSLLEKQKAEILALMTGTTNIQSMPKATLKRLPMWGTGVNADQVNFEWPTQDLLDQMPSDVIMKSIEFKSYSNSRQVLNSVQCTLSDGTKSPVFQKENVSYYLP